jgi:hypothetical protein
VPTTHPKICRFVCQPLPLSQIDQTLQDLRTKLHQVGPDQIKQLMRQAIPDYAPYLAVTDLAPSKITNLKEFRPQAEQN